MKKWRVFWRVTLPNGEVDKGSRSFETKRKAKRFKEHCERRTKLLKRAKVTNQVLFTDALPNRRKWKACAVLDEIMNKQIEEKIKCPTPQDELNENNIG